MLPCLVDIKVKWNEATSVFSFLNSHQIHNNNSCQLLLSFLSFILISYKQQWHKIDKTILCHVLVLLFLVLPLLYIIHFLFLQLLFIYQFRWNLKKYGLNIGHHWLNSVLWKVFPLFKILKVFDNMFNWRYLSRSNCVRTSTYALSTWKNILFQNKI